MERGHLPVDRVQHPGSRVAVPGEARRVEVVQRAAGWELRVHEVARQAEHHRLTGAGVDAEQDDRVGADPVAADVAVPTEQQHVDPLPAAPRVGDRDAGRQGGGLVVLEELGDQLGLHGRVPRRQRER
jgi:hypothetical protein